jgi:hypothetical protein
MIEYYRFVTRNISLYRFGCLVFNANKTTNCRLLNFRLTICIIQVTMIIKTRLCFSLKEPSTYYLKEVTLYTDRLCLVH